MEICSRTGSGKFSRLRRPWISSLAVAASVVSCAGIAWAQAPSDDASSDGIDALDRFLDTVHSFSADFEQEVWDADQTLVETSVGTVSLKRPDRFRWTYMTPYEQIVLSDGRRLWMYDVDLKQATVTSLDELGTTSPAMLLSGDESVRDGFEEQSFVRDGMPWVRLRPRVSDPEFREVSIRFAAGLPDVVEFVNGLDQTTRITFSAAVVNPVLDDRLFEFHRPRGVDVLGDEG